MENVAETNHRVRFKVFELDTHTRELFRDGIRVRLQGQPIEVLEMLLERPGELVTREQLRKKLWPQDTFVDFEHSLNSAVTRLREALGDKAEGPKFIETLPRLGYRFVAPVTDGENDATISAPIIDIATHHPELVAQPISVVHSQLDPKEARVKSDRTHWVFASGVAVIVMCGTAFVWYIRRPLPPPRIANTEQITQDVKWAYKAPLGMDENRIYIRTEPPGLRQVPITGGEISTTTLLLPWSFPESAYISDVSPDGSEALVRGFSAVKPTILPMWIMSTSGIPIRYVGRAYDGAWSPDGKQVIFSSDEDRVYTVPSGGGEPHLLFTSKVGTPWRFSWCPDGKRIRFSVGYGQIWEISSDGSNLREFLPKMRGSRAKCCGRWTPDGDYYVFTSSELPFINPLHGGQLWALDERRGGLRGASPDPVQLTSNPLQWIYPVISPDSRTIYATGIVNNGELVRLDSRSGRFEPFLGGISAMSMEFSRDGKQVVYVSYPGRKIWRANSDGTGKTLLGEPPGEPVGGLHWSPDGSKILYYAGFEVFVIPAPGGSPVRLPIKNTGYEPAASWSPDSRSIVYRLFQPLQPEKHQIEILDLTTNQSVPLPPATKPMFAPKWSPDGRYIFASGGVPGTRSAVFDNRAQNWIYFTESPPVDVAVWSHDSRYVYITSDVAVDKAIYRLSVPGGKVERIADLKGLKSTGTWGGWFGLDPNDTPLLLRDAGTVEIYALRLAMDQ